MGKLRSRSGMWLLSLLAIRAGKEVDRSWLAAMLWPDADEPTGLANLRRTLTDLRSALGEESGRLQSPTTRSLVLDPRDCFIDVIEFQRLIAKGDRQSLSDAVELHTSPLLEGCTEEWITEEREPRIAECVSAIERLSEFAEDAADPSEAILRLKQVLAIEPLRESAARRLIQILAARGNYAEAVNEFRSLRDRLRYQLNLDPSAETIATFKAIRSDAKQKAANVEASNFASHDPPPYAEVESQSAKASTIPIPLTPLIGREIEAEELIGLIREFRLVSMIGSGGMGKTRLAIHVASRMESVFEGGVYFVDLAPVDGGAFVVNNIAAVVGAKEVGGSDVEQALIADLRDREVLIVLDNCEHLVEAAGYAAQRLLTSCPNVRFLVTSRQQLGLPGEQSWRIPAMESPREDGDGAEDMLQFDAIKLFVDRARAVRPGFSLLSSNSSAVAGICRRLDGCPLAIELAAARTSVLAVEQIAERLDDRFKLLTSTNRNAMPRQQTLRALIDWSYNLLDETEKTGLRRLSAFHGGCTVEDAERMLEDIDLGELYLGVFDVLAALVDKSLLIADHDDFGTRYRMLESIRAYGLEKLRDEQEQAAVLKRHRNIFLDIAELGEKGMQSPQQMVWMKRYSIERDNFRSALQFSIDEENGDAAMRLAFAQWRFWEMRTEFSEGLQMLDKALALDDGPDGKIRGRALSAHAILSWRRGKMDQAKKSYEASIEIAQKYDDKYFIAAGTNGLANIANMSADHETAVSMYERALAAFEEIGNDAGIATIHLNIGSVHHTNGRFQEARFHTEKSLEIRRRLGDKRAIASVSDALAVIVADLGEHEYARRCAMEALNLYLEIGSKHGIHLLLNSMSEVANAAGHWEDVAAFLGASDHWYHELSVEKSGLLQTIDSKMMENALRHISQEEYDAAYRSGYGADHETIIRKYLERLS